MSRILQGKRALVFGAGGSIGRTVAKEFAAEGADVYLSGRSKSKLVAVAKEIDVNGRAHVAVVDTTNPVAVEAYVGALAEATNGIDIVFNASGPPAQAYGNGKAAVDSTLEEFSAALDLVVKPQYITASAAARQMTKQGSGVILFQTGSPARAHTPGATSIGTAFGAMETFAENLAFEVSPLGVRVVCLRTVANIDTEVIQRTADLVAQMRNIPKEQVISLIAEQNFLGTAMSVKDTAQILAFLASDRARRFTGTVVNATAGASLD